MLTGGDGGGDTTTGKQLLFWLLNKLNFVISSCLFVFFVCAYGSVFTFGYF